MSEGVTLVLLVFLFVAALITVLALLMRPSRLRVKLSLPWKTGLYIDTSKPGWHPTRRKAKDQAPSGDGQARLVAKIRGRGTWEFPLNRTRHTYIGRNRDMDVVLKDPSADTRHAVIFWRKDRFHINNLSSRGTKVNGRWITTQRLGNGNKIRMGNTELIFRERH